MVGVLLFVDLALIATSVFALNCAVRHGHLRFLARMICWKCGNKLIPDATGQGWCELCRTMR